MIALNFILILLVCESIAFEEYGAYDDVGTVLFSPSDMKKGLWSNTELGLLRARKEFLELIPPIHLLDTKREDFSKLIHDYLKDTFSELQKESPDIETNELLKTALADTIGGYLKMWVLPITKFAYYGGTAPQDDALKLFELHKDIKDYLNTDGKGWKDPNVYFLKSMSVNVAPLDKVCPRNARDSCDGLSYFEKTDTGLEIPMPNINWDDGIECMFIPLKNQHPISLSSPNSSTTLLNYYNTAKNCIETKKIEDEGSYDDRLQTWIEQDVLPHLSDEKIYPAFRSILTLVNKTKDFCDNLIDTYASQSQPCPKKTHIVGIPIDLSSKKMMVITIIIILEIAWCIPTLCYLIFTRMKRKKDKDNVLFFFSPSKHNRKGGILFSNWSKCSNVTHDSSRDSRRTPVKKCISTGQTPRTRSMIVETCFTKPSEHSTGAGTRSNFVCQLRPNDIDKLDHATSLKSSFCRTVEIKSNCIANQKHIPVTKSKCPLNSNNSNNIAADIQPAKTVTILQQRGINEEIRFLDETKKTKAKNVKTSKRQSKIHPVVMSSSATEYYNKKPLMPSKTSMSTRKPSTTTMNSADYATYKSKRFEPKKSVKVYTKSTAPNPKPRNENVDETMICFDIKCLTGSKPSKIPKRSFMTSITQTSSTKKPPSTISGKTLIPLRKRQLTMDDIGIQRQKKTKKNGKLNETL